MAGRPTLGSTRLDAAALVVAVVVVVVLLVAVVGGLGGSGGGAASVSSEPSGASSPLHEALQGINDDGTWSKDTALAVFAAAFGPLPGVPTPRRDTSYHSGTLAIRMVQAHWSELTADQQQAVRDYVGPASAGAIVPASYHAGLVETYQQLADQDAADIAAAYGHPLGIPINVVLTAKENGDAWAWATGIWPIEPAGSHGNACTMNIPPSTANDTSRAPYMRWVLLHEAWHCFEYAMVGYDTFMKAPAWVTEGEASWVAEAITGGVGAPPPEATNWSDYVRDPEKPLYKRAYDGVGFHVQLTQNGINPWTVFPAMIVAGGSDAAFEASGANTPSFADRWGSSWFRDARPSGDWAMSSGYGISPLTRLATPHSIILGDGDEDAVVADPNAASIANVKTTAFVTRVEVPSGSGRVADASGGGLDRVVRAGILHLCTNPDGDCTCPSGAGLTGTPLVAAPPELRVAATGEERVGARVGLRGLSKDDWCGPKPTPTHPATSPCKSECGGSNGDPHLRTISGDRYDLQAAGEYVLLRSPDGSVEIQARQERSGTGAATINTGLAVGVNGHRVGFYPENGVLAVHLDGATLPGTDVGGADLGTGASLTAYNRGYELDLPDGTTVWALSMGQWGINVLVRPSDALRASGVGLIGHVPQDAGLRIPTPPDGTSFAVPVDRHERYHDVYEVLAPAWRVTDATSLFDYAAGKTTESFTLAGFPPETVPQSSDELDATALATARTTCAGVSDPDLAEQCAYDVAVTGAPEYVTLYTMTTDLQTQGPATLDQPLPGTTPAPPPSGGTATGIDLVEDHIGGVGSAMLGPDGTLYVLVAEQAKAFGDVQRTLLAVDPATGAIKQRAAAVATGRLAWAAGSVWAGEFKRGDTGCAVSRLDPVTLAVQANVPTVCSESGFTLFAAVGDEIWFVDPTGADANGHGAHLRRIDPATNKVDGGATGSIELPFLTPFLGNPAGSTVFSGTSDGLIYGDRRQGLYRFSAGSGSVEPLGMPDGFQHLFPAGQGAWTQTVLGDSSDPTGTASFFTGGSTFDTEVGVIGDLAGADDSAVYADYAAEDDEVDQLSRYPTDHGSPSLLMTSGFVPNGFGGQMRLLYRDLEGPLLIGDGVVVKLWLVPPASGDGPGSLMLQSAPLP